jgi:cytochrome c-type biogenesis protein
MIINNFISAFILGLLTPLTAVCVLPLYPGFLAYLSNQTNKKRSLAYFGLLISGGVILFMLLLGLIFTTILQESLTSVIEIVSPIAFAILLIISILLIFDIDFGKIFPKVKSPITKNPYLTALIYGFLFGAIVIPCNPAFIAALFARSLLILNPIVNIFNFLFFGLGIGAPLLVFSLVSTNYSSQIINYLTSKKRIINLVAGSIMFAISLYYLIFVFNILNIT